MKSLRFLFVFIFLTFISINTCFAEDYKPYPEQTRTFSYQDSYEFVDLLTTFALPKGSTEYDWIGINNSQKFDKVAFMENIPQIKTSEKPSYRFGGMVGLLFNGNGHNNSGFAADAFFICPVWDGYSNLLITLNYSPGHIYNAIGKHSSRDFIATFISYLEGNNVAVINTKKIPVGHYRNDYLLTISIPEKAPVYLRISYWAGSGGIIGQTTFNMSFNKKYVQ